MTTKESTLTVGDIRKAIANLSDDCEVHLDIAADNRSDEIEQAMADIVLERAFRDVLNGYLIIDGQVAV